jgi:hypothetical protein
MMSSEAERESREQCSESLERIQNFDVKTLPREAELGKTYSFNDAKDPAKRIVDLFNRLSISALDDFGKTQLDQLKNQADATFNLFDSVLKFDPKLENAHSTKESLIQQITNAYQAVFNVILPLVGYSLHKTADFQRLDTDARAALQQIRDDADKITNDLEKQKSDAELALESIRSVAAEQGVTQQAIYFKTEADNNETEAGTWKDNTIKVSWLLGAYAIFSLFLHKIPFIAPVNTYETVQMAVSKVLIFAVISFILYLFAKNFIAFKHNAIVNRHRQNALLTYKALVEAAGDNQQASDAVLIQAASCIYAPQPTGYTSSNADGQGAKSVIELLSKPISTTIDK